MEVLVDVMMDHKCVRGYVLVSVHAWYDWWWPSYRRDGSSSTDDDMVPVATHINGTVYAYKKKRHYQHLYREVAASHRQDNIEYTYQYMKGL